MRQRSPLHRGVWVPLVAAVLVVVPVARAEADQPKADVATGVTQVAGALTDPVGRIWVSDRVAGFCRLTQPTSTPGSIDTPTCVGGSLAGAGAGPSQAGAPALADPTPDSVGSGDEMALIPDRAPSSAEVTRATWNTQTQTFTFHSKLTLFDGDVRPTAVSFGADKDAYVIFQRSRAVVRIVDPTAAQPALETVAFVTSPGPLAIAAGDPVGTGAGICVYVAETTGLKEFFPPSVGKLSSAAPVSSYSVGVVSALVYDPTSNMLYAGTAAATTAGQDTVKRVDISSGQVDAAWATGFSRIGGLGRYNDTLIVADDVGLIGATNPTGTGSVYLTGQSSGQTSVRIVSGPTLADGSLAPDPTITNDPTPTFTVASDAGVALQCAISSVGSSPTWADCTSGTFTPPALADGAYTFAVRAGATGIPVSRDFTIDTTAPAAPTIGAPAANQIVGRQVTLSVTAENGVTLTCAMDSDVATAYQPCASGDTLTSTTEGAHVLRVKAKDRAGNVGPVSQVGFTVDLTAPALSITSPDADGAVLTAAPVFTFTSSSTDVAGFQCRIDAAPFAPCTSPASYTAVVAGSHTFQVQATDTAGNQSVQSRTFTLVVPDTTAPVVSASPASGAYAVGTQITLTANETAKIYYTTDGTPPTTASALYSGPLTLTTGFTLTYIGVDAAGNTSTVASQTYTVAVVVAGDAHDFNGDGHPDVLARDSGGALWLYPGNGSGGFLARKQVGSGWAGMSTILSPGDFNGDGNADLLARDTAGVLWLYPGNGAAGFLARTQVATGWKSLTAILSPDDFNGDGHSDVLARDGAGALWLYPGNGSGGFLARKQVGSGWNGMTAILSPGDFNGDGHSDVLARDGAGALWLYPGNGSGGFLARKQVGSGWNGMTAILSPGDFNGDGHSDVLARDSGGALWLYPGNGSGGFLTRKQVGSGWNGMTAIL